MSPRFFIVDLSNEPIWISPSLARLENGKYHRWLTEFENKRTVFYPISVESEQFS